MRHTINQKTLEDLQQRLEKLERNNTKDQLTMVIMSNNLDRCLAALIIATGAAAMGTTVVMFFTFWGVTLLRDKNKNKKNKSFLAKIFAFMLPNGANKLKLSQMDFFGIGRKMIHYLMRKKNVAQLEELLDLAKDVDIKFLICEMSMDLMDFSIEEMISYPNLGIAGVATFLEESSRSRTTLFI